jgi:hypothetical protein
VVSENFLNVQENLYVRSQKSSVLRVSREREEKQFDFALYIFYLCSKMIKIALANVH